MSQDLCDQEHEEKVTRKMRYKQFCVTSVLKGLLYLMLHRNKRKQKENGFQEDKQRSRALSSILGQRDKKQNVSHGGRSLEIPTFILEV